MYVRQTFAENNSVYTSEHGICPLFEVKHSNTRCLGEGGGGKLTAKKMIRLFIGMSVMEVLL